MKRLWIGLIALAFLSPLGLILPAKLGAGSAWGEWSAEEIKVLTGFIPAHLGRLSNLWQAPMPDYALKGQDESGLAALSISYILSAVLGVAFVCVAAFLLGGILARRAGRNSNAA